MAPKQEQEDASEEITEVAPGILRLQLPIDFTGLGHVNCYAIEDDRGFALVDPGMPGATSWQALTGRLDSAEIPLRRVHFKPRSWGGMAEDETYAHLEHLRRRGRAEVREEAGVLRYKV